MIVEPDFVHHWKTELLRSLLEEPTAEAYVIRFWSYCQQRKEWVFPKLSPKMLAGIVRWQGDLDQLWDAFLQSGFLEETEDGWAAHDWAEVNGTIVRNWTNGRSRSGLTQTESGLTQGGKKGRNRVKSAPQKGGSGSTQTKEKPVDSQFGSTQTGKKPVDSAVGSGDRIGLDRIGEDRSTYQTFLGGRLITNFSVSDELLGLLAKAEGADVAAFQESLESALRDGGWKVEREVKVDDRGDGRPGRVDIEARSAHTSVGIECDFRSAREKSITKLSRNYEFWAVICRESAGLLPDVAADGSDLWELRERVCRMFGHEGALPKDRKVSEAWNALVKRCAIREADVELLEWWYGNKKNPPPKLRGRYWARASVHTLMRNWAHDLLFIRNVVDEHGGEEAAEEEPEDEEDDQAMARRGALGPGEEWRPRKAHPVPEGWYAEAKTEARDE